LHDVIVYTHIFWERKIRIIYFLQRFIIGSKTGCDCNRTGVIVDDTVVINFNIGCGQYNDPIAGCGIAYTGTGSKTSGFCEILFIVIMQVIVVRFYMSAPL